MNLINGASACNIYWQVGSSAVLGGQTFYGNVLALGSITLTSATQFTGRALARTGAVTISIASLPDQLRRQHKPRRLPHQGGLLPRPASAPPHRGQHESLDSAWTGVTAYNATITVFEQKGLAIQNLVFKYTFRKPTTVTVDVVGGTNNGVSLLWKGGDTVSAHRGGIISAFKKTLSLHDPQVTTIRGSSFDELSFAQILAHMQTTPGRLAQSAGPLIDNVATDSVTLTPTHPATNAATARNHPNLPPNPLPPTRNRLPRNTHGPKHQRSRRQIHALTLFQRYSR